MSWKSLTLDGIFNVINLPVCDRAEFCYKHRIVYMLVDHQHQTILHISTFFFL